MYVLRNGAQVVQRRARRQKLGRRVEPRSIIRIKTKEEKKNKKEPYTPQAPQKKINETQINDDRSGRKKKNAMMMMMMMMIRSLVLKKGIPIKKEKTSQSCYSFMPDALWSFGIFWGEPTDKI